MIKTTPTTLFVIFFLFCSSTVQAAKSLYVDGATGNDAYSYEENDSTHKWLTIGRACALATAGDTVYVSAGRYTVVGTNSRTIPALNPTNSGTSGNLITFQAVGTVDFAFSSGIGPVFGANGVDYIKWTGFSVDEALALSAPDTGPVVLWNTTGSVIDRCILDGNGTRGVDNHNGVRIEDSTNCTVSNCIMHDFTVAVVNQVNGNGICNYNSTGNTYEHNEVYNSGSGIFFKSGDAGPNAIVRYNYLHDNSTFGIGVTYSTTTIKIYQNLCENNGVYSIQLGGGSPKNVYIVNNTFVGGGIYARDMDSAETNNIVWNNIVFHSIDYALIFETSDYVSTGIDCEHNIYHGSSTADVYQSGNLTLAQWQSTYSQDSVSPASITSDPLFNTGVYTLQAGSPALTLGRTITAIHGSSGEIIPAGCYIIGNETMGVESEGTPAVPNLTGVTIQGGSVR